MSKEAMKLALEALEIFEAAGQWTRYSRDSIFALREALDHIANGGKMIEQEQQQPVVHQYQGRAGEWHNFMNPKHYEATVKEGSWPIRALYTSPPAQRTWVGLTDEDKCKPDLGKWVEISDEWMDGYTAGLEYGETKLKEKNT